MDALPNPPPPRSLPPRLSILPRLISPHLPLPSFRAGTAAATIQGAWRTHRLRQQLTQRLITARQVWTKGGGDAVRGEERANCPGGTRWEEEREGGARPPPASHLCACIPPLQEHDARCQCSCSRDCMTRAGRSCTPPSLSFPPFPAGAQRALPAVAAAAVPAVAAHAAPHPCGHPCARHA